MGESTAQSAGNSVGIDPRKNQEFEGFGGTEATRKWVEFSLDQQAIGRYSSGFSARADIPIFVS